MAADTLPTPLQESVLTTLTFDKRWGALIAAQVTPDNFDDPYREIARRVLDYRKRYGRPPGQEHLDDLFGEILGGRSKAKNAGTLKHVLLGMAAQAEGLNGEYVAGRVGDMVHEQRIKQALFLAGERYQQGGDNRIVDVEAILREALQPRGEQMDAGVFLNDTKKTLSFLDLDQDLIPLGIPEIDRLGIGLIPQELLLYIGPKGTGKTMFSVHCGKQALLHRERVVHITNETRTARVIGRYYQSFFAAARKPDRTDQTVFEFDRLGRMVGFRREQRKPSLSWQDPDVRQQLRDKIKPWGAQFGRLVVRDYPSGSLTIPIMTNYLDFLEQAHGFIPTVLIVDSPDKFKIPLAEFRLGTRRVYEDLRGLASSRNLAIMATTQGNRESIGARQVRSTNVAEDIGKVQEADNVLTFSRTEAEERFGLGRLSVQHARNTEGGAMVLLAQNYALGQYVTDSTYLDPDYWKRLREKSGDPNVAEGDELLT